MSKYEVSLQVDCVTDDCTSEGDARLEAQALFIEYLQRGELYLAMKVKEIEDELG
jgi:hypothetical protein